MYEKFFGLHDKPFSLLPDPRFFFSGRQHSMAYAVLEYSILNQAGFTAVTGDVGCGKTTLLRYLLNHLPDDITVGILYSTTDIAADLIKWVLLAFKIDYKNKELVELHEVFEAFLLRQYASGRRTVLFVDEAQTLDVSALERLRLLSNINVDQDLLLQIVVFGQPELRQRLNRPELNQFRQRISASYHLGPLTEDETYQYIDHRLACAGATSQIFDLEARRLVYQYSQGVPREINILCDTSLVYAYAEGNTEIHTAIVDAVIKDRVRTIDPPHQTPLALVRPLEDRAATTDEKTGPRFEGDMARELFPSLRKP